MLTSVTLTTVAGVDYPNSIVQVTFPSTSVSGNSTCADIIILEDEVFEGEHTFGVQLVPDTPPIGVIMLATPAFTLVFIEDDDGKPGIHNCTTAC